jgi:hypothetical protein
MSAIGSWYTIFQRFSAHVLKLNSDEDCMAESRPCTTDRASINYDA